MSMKLITHSVYAGHNSCQRPYVFFIPKVV